MLYRNAKGAAKHLNGNEILYEPNSNLVLFGHSKRMSLCEDKEGRSERGRLGGIIARRQKAVMLNICSLTDREGQCTSG